MNQKHIIIDGATSFIGIALIKELLESNCLITAIIRPDSCRKNILKNQFQDLEIIECDIGNLLSLEKIDISYDYYYHIAWSSDFENPRYNFQGQFQNVEYLLDALRLAKNLGCHKFLAIGSQAECGIVSTPIDSKTPDAPITAYAKAKCEAYSRACKMSDDLGIDFYWPRLLSAYGLYDRPATLVMSCIASCIKKNIIPITPAEQIWDYVYVNDVAKALKLIIEKGEPKKKYAIASGVGRILKEYINEIAEVFYFPELLEGIGKRQYSEKEVMYLVGNVNELYDDTGMKFDTNFKHNISNLKTMISKDNLFV